MTPSANSRSSPIELEIGSCVETASLRRPPAGQRTNSGFFQRSGVRREPRRAPSSPVEPRRGLDLLDEPGSPAGSAGSLTPNPAFSTPDGASNESSQLLRSYFAATSALLSRYLLVLGCTHGSEMSRVGRASRIWQEPPGDLQLASSTSPRQILHFQPGAPWAPAWTSLDSA